jgi:hypothetical protein
MISTDHVHVALVDIPGIGLALSLPWVQIIIYNFTLKINIWETVRGIHHHCHTFRWMHYATSRKVVGWIPDEVNLILPVSLLPWGRLSL